MNKEKSNMDDFLREALGGLEVKPSQNVWKKVSKRLLILELLRFNFTNIGKAWLYSGLAVITTVVGFSYFQVNHKTLPNDEGGPLELTTSRANSSKAEAHIISQNNITHELAQDSHIIENKNIADVRKDADAITTIEKNHTYKSINKAKIADSLINSHDDKTDADAQEKRNWIDVPVVLATNDIKDNIPTPFKAVSTGIIQTTQNSDLTEQVPSHRQEITAVPIPRLKPHYISSKSNTLVIYMQGGQKAISPIIIGGKTHMGKLPTSVRTATKIKRERLKPSKVKNKPISSHAMGEQQKAVEWAVGFSYLPIWPLVDDIPISPSQQFAIHGSLLWKNMEFNLGVGIRGDEITARVENQYSSYDSIGFYYHIDYYESVPGNSDSIIIHYTTKAVFDTVSHTSIQDQTQHSRWIVVPIEIGYQLLQRNSFVLQANISARIGWEYYRESITPKNISTISGINAHNIGTRTTSSFVTIGLGVEGQYKIYRNWWLVLEPRAFYYLKSPYKWDGSQVKGQFGMGVKAGIKFKF